MSWKKMCVTQDRKFNTEVYSQSAHFLRLKKLKIHVTIVCLPINICIFNFLSKCFLSLIFALSSGLKITQLFLSDHNRGIDSIKSACRDIFFRNSLRNCGVPYVSSLLIFWQHSLAL